MCSGLFLVSTIYIPRSITSSYVNFSIWKVIVQLRRGNAWVGRKGRIEEVYFVLCEAEDSIALRFSSSSSNVVRFLAIFSGRSCRYRDQFLVPTIILTVQVVPELLKVWSGTESVLVLQIRPPLADLPYVCHHPFSESDFAVVLFSLAVSVELRHFHQEVGCLTFTARQRAGHPLPPVSMSSWKT